jgi:hypothetical protein
VVAEARSTRARKSSSAVPMIVDDSDLRGELDRPDDEPPLATPARRSSSGALKKQSSSKIDMPVAPPRRSQPKLEGVEDRPKKKKKGLYDSSDNEPSIDVTGIRMRQKKTLRTAITAVVFLAGVGLLFLFREPLTGVLSGVMPKGGPTPVLVTLSSNPKTRVTVVKPSGERLDLGEVPIERARGTNVGDTVVMANADLGITFEETIQFGQPNENWVRVKDFAQGKLKLTVTPNSKNLSIWRGNQHIATNISVPISLYEGTQRLEVHGDNLREPVKFEVLIKPNEVVPFKVDISSALTK